MDKPQPIESSDNSITGSSDGYESVAFRNIRQDIAIIGDEFYECLFEDCKFNECTFDNCRFEKCTFRNCDLSLLKPLNSRFIDVVFEDTKMIGINWTNAKMPLDVQFRKCILNYSTFSGLNMRNVRIAECTSLEVDYSEADLSRADFDSTDLSRSKFHSTNLTEADFSTALNYDINPNQNRLKKTVFSLPEAITLLNSFDIIIK